MSDACVYCGLPAVTRDHLVPKSTGLNLGPHNLVPACRGCNQIKGSMLPSALHAQAEALRVLADKVSDIACATEKLLRERGLASVLPTP